MMPLTSFFKNPFADGRISLAQLLAFTTDHLERLKSANLPALAPRVPATEAALAALLAALAADGSKLGQRKGRKQTKRSFRRGLGARVARLQASVMAHFGVKAPEVKEIFPRGRQAFTKCTDDALAPLLTGLAAALAVRAADLGAAVVSAGEALAAEWATVYAASEAVSGEKAAAETGVRSARSALQRELLLNLLALAAQFPAEPEQLALHMQQSLLLKKRAKKTDPVAK